MLAKWFREQARSYSLWGQCFFPVLIGANLRNLREKAFRIGNWIPAFARMMGIGIYPLSAPHAGGTVRHIHKQNKEGATWRFYWW